MNNGERGLTWSNTIAIERLLVWQLLSLAQRLLPDLLRLLCGPESPTPLLIHLCARRNTIHSHEEEFFGFYLPEKMIHVGEYRRKYLLL